MKAVLTRVLSASVKVDGSIISSIDHGLLALIGIGVDDTPDDLKTLVNKILTLRLWPGPNDEPWRASVKDVGGSILCVSQFTLQAKVKKGSKPDYHGVMSPGPAEKMYDEVRAALGKAYDPSRIHDGKFGAMMEVASVNDGPITIVFDTKEPKAPAKPKGGSSAPSTGMTTPQTPLTPTEIEPDSQ